MMLFAVVSESGKVYAQFAEHYKAQDLVDEMNAAGDCGHWHVEALEEDGGIEVVEGGEHIELSGSVIHRTYVQSTVARCSTCDGGMCFDCTDPA